MPNLGLELAQKAVQKALELSRTEYGNRPLSVAVCDKNGFLMAFAKMDDAAKRYDMPKNYVMGANIAGFEKVVNAMMAHGV